MDERSENIDERIRRADAEFADLRARTLTVVFNESALEEDRDNLLRLALTWQEVDPKGTGYSSVFDHEARSAEDEVKEIRKMLAQADRGDFSHFSYVKTDFTLQVKSKEQRESVKKKLEENPVVKKVENGFYIV